MGAKYVYHYFNGQGRGEAVRWIFALAGQDFQDHRIEGSEWAAFKAKTPYGTLPFLEVDGKSLGESLTIQRFLARKFNLVGKTEWENARVDELVDYVTDSRKTYPLWVDSKFFDNEPEKAEKIKEEYLKIAPRPLGKLQEILASNNQGRGYFIGDSPTWADISVACYLDTVERFREGFLNDYPLLKSHRERVRGLKGIKEWIEKRPKTEW